jgi:VCBS repeat-containing protein
MRFRLSFALVLALCACGRDPALTSPAAVSPTRSMEGAIVKGPLVGATVNFFHIDDAGQPIGIPIQTVVSDALGHVSVTLPSSSELLLAVTSGGSYVDESDDAGGDARRRITLGAGEGFQSIVPPNATSFAITPYTMALLLRAREIANGGNFGVVYPLVVSQAIQAFGFNPTTVIPDDPLLPNLDTPDAAKYGLLLGGAAYAIDAIATASGVQVTYQTILAFIEDLSDGILDGSLNGSQINFKSVTIGGNTISINGETLRFRNNHYQEYLDLIATIDEDSLSVTPPDLPTDLPPVARNDSMTVVRGHSQSILDSGADSVLANDSVTGGGTLTAMLETPPTHGTLSLSPDGTFNYHNDGSNATTDLFTYTAHTATASSAPATVFIDITGGGNDPCNGGGQPPTKSTGDFVACDDLHYQVQCSQSIFEDVRNNDIIPPFDASLSAELIGSVSGLVWNGNGTFSYFAPSCFPSLPSKAGGDTETESFSYRLHLIFGEESEIASNVANVKIAVDFSCVKTNSCCFTTGKAFCGGK